MKVGILMPKADRERIRKYRFFASLRMTGQGGSGGTPPVPWGCRGIIEQYAVTACCSTKIGPG